MPDRSLLGKSIVTDYALQQGQREPESSAVFVLEHQPRRCKAYPTSGEMSFENIVVEVDGQVVASPEWSALQEQPACNSKAQVVDSATIKFTWDPTAADPQQLPTPTNGTLAKWGVGGAIM